MKKILFVGAEAMPFAATGGLGDVLGSLPTAIHEAAEGEADVRVVMPLYSAVSADFRSQMTLVQEYEVCLSWRRQYCGIYSLVKGGVTYYFIDNEYYFKRDSLYGCFDDGERFAFFCKAAVDMLGVIGFYPDVLHAHDWQAALSLVYLNGKYRQVAGYEAIQTVFTIHNIEYQGKYDFGILGDVFELGEEDRELVEYDGCINLMKAAIVCADRVSTVSPQYAKEIQTPEYAHGLDGILRQQAEKLCGILNGIDYDYYNPGRKGAVAKTYSWRTIPAKYENKAALQAELGLPQKNDVPMLSVISRLASHKGLDLISEMAYDFLSEHEVQLVILGKGESGYESFFEGLQQAFPDRVRALITYDRSLANRIYAATDIFLMPSKSEPCGLSQMIASRFGAIPVTRETGGLYDSIKGYWEEKGRMHGNGFTFAGYSAAELAERTGAAVALWQDEEKRKKLIGRIMRTDFSWKTSALKYLEMYASL
ncbi:MAG: glycogen synthase GlgA [Ruminococcaceae bacterium]|nr:glycogen synthase GlgA [Oscillospiraceae bacterium]